MEQTLQPDSRPSLRSQTLLTTQHSRVGVVGKQRADGLSILLGDDLEGGGEETERMEGLASEFEIKGVKRDLQGVYKGLT